MSTKRGRTAKKPPKRWTRDDVLAAAKASDGKLSITHSGVKNAIMLHRFGVCMMAVKDGMMRIVHGPIQVGAMFELTLKGRKYLESLEDKQED